MQPLSMHKAIIYHLIIFKKIPNLLLLIVHLLQILEFIFFLLLLRVILAGLVLKRLFQALNVH